MSDPTTPEDARLPTMSLRWITRGQFHPYRCLQQLVADDAGIRTWVDVPHVGGHFHDDQDS